MATLRETARSEIKSATEVGVLQLVAGLRDGTLSADELENAIVEVVSVAIDAAIPTGPLEAFNDAVIRAGVVAVYRVAAELLERDPARMRRRAERLRDRGRSREADALEQRAAEVAERQLVRGTVGSGG